MLWKKCPVESGLESKKKKLYNESLIEKISQTKTKISAGAVGRKEGLQEKTNPKDFNLSLKSVDFKLKRIASK